MAYKISAEGANAFTLNEETVETLQYGDVSSKNSDARARDSFKTITATGRIRSVADGEAKDESLTLAQFALIPASSKKAYQKVTAQALAAGQITRKYEFPEAFVVSYRERFSAETGVGEFKAVLRQKKDTQDRVGINGGYADD